MRLIVGFLVAAAVLVAFIKRGAILDIMSAAMGDEMPHEETMVPMRDGIRLLTRVWLPEGASSVQQVPAVLSRGYWPRSERHARRFTEKGYAFVAQTSRGEPGSEGELNRFFSDAEDGYDTLSWIADRSWSDGKIAMFGPSYWGATQWLVAPLKHPNLSAIIPQNIDADLWRCGYRCNGALTLAMTASGRAYSDPKTAREFGWERLYRYLPLVDLDLAVSGRQNKLWRDYVLHAEYDEFWQKISLRGKFEDVQIPVYMMSGWYDYYAGAAFNNYKELKQAGNSSDLRVAIGPSDHLNRVVGDRDFGDDAEFDDIAQAVRWLDHVVRGKANGIADEPPIRIFVMGANEWRLEDNWPLDGTRFVPFYFHGANGGEGGQIHPAPPEQSASFTEYLYDPEDPVPTLGGNHSFLGTDRPDLIRVGAVDQRPNEDRPDVLVFTSPILRDSLEITGPVELVLYAESSAVDTDFTAKLIDVQPDGTAYNLTEGIIRTRFRKSIHGSPELMTPGEVYEIRFHLHPTSNVFMPGHRIRVHLTSSNFPLWDRNPNTGHEQGIDDVLQIAHQKIHHSARYASHIVLPVILRGDAEWPRQDI